MKKSTRCLLFSFILLFMGNTGFAGQNSLVNGVRVLDKNDVAVSFNLGLELPAPLLYSLRFDYEISDKVQIGLEGIYVDQLYSVALPIKYNFFRSEDATHNMGIEVTPAFSYLDLSGFLDGVVNPLRRAFGQPDQHTTTRACPHKS